MFAPLASSAQTAGELKAKIQALLDQVKQLQIQLDGLTGGQNKRCHTFNTNLGVGAKGDEVAALESALGQEGFSVEHSSNFASVFDERLAAAVTGFQEKYRDEILTPNVLTHGTGYVGKATRAKLNQLYGCGNNLGSSLAFTFPQQGSQWTIGRKYTVSFNQDVMSDYHGLTHSFVLVGRNGLSIGSFCPDYSIAPTAHSLQWLAGFLITGCTGTDQVPLYASPGQYKITFQKIDANGSFVQTAESGWFWLVASKTTTQVPSISFVLRERDFVCSIKSLFKSFATT